MAVLIRELSAGDRAALAFVFHRLGARSRYQRFMRVRTELDPAELDRLAAVDHWHAEALVAWSPVPRAPIGVARYVRGADFDVAEVAVAVVDEWQRRGVGGALVLALRERAVRAGIHRFTATALVGNRGALRLVRRLDPAPVTRIHGEVLELAGSWRP